MLREFGVEPLERFEVLTLIGMEERFAEERIFVVRTGDYRERCHRADDKPLNENAAHGYQSSSLIVVPPTAPLASLIPTNFGSTSLLNVKLSWDSKSFPALSFPEKTTSS